MVSSDGDGDDGDDHKNENKTLTILSLPPLNSLHSIGDVGQKYHYFMFVFSVPGPMLNKFDLDFCFYFHDSWRWIEKDLTTIYVQEWSAYVFFYKCYSITFRPYI